MNNKIPTNDFLNKAIAGAWALLACWYIYIGCEILWYITTIKSSLFDFYPVPAAYPGECIVLGVISLTLAVIIAKDNADKIQYLFVFLGASLIATISRDAMQIGGFGPVIVLVFLIWTKNLRQCLLLFLISVIFYLSIRISHSHHVAQTNIGIISCLLVVGSFMLFKKNKSLSEIEIAGKYRAMIWLGLAPILLAEFL